jgi:hypothetical protein
MEQFFLRLANRQRLNDLSQSAMQTPDDAGRMPAPAKDENPFSFQMRRMGSPAPPQATFFAIAAVGTIDGC